MIPLVNSTAVPSVAIGNTSHQASSDHVTLMESDANAFVVVDRILCKLMREVINSFHLPSEESTTNGLKEKHNTTPSFNIIDIFTLLQSARSRDEAHYPEVLLW